MATVREASFADYEQVERLKARYGLAAYTEAQWRHIYEDSPLLARRRLPWPLGWVIETDGKEIVGYIGNVPLEYEFKNKPLVGAAASLWVVTEEYRGQSLALVRRFFRQETVDLFLDTTATHRAAVVFEKLGAKRPPAVVYDRASFWVLDRPGFLRSLFAHKRLKLPGVLACPAAGLLRAAETILKPAHLSPAVNASVELCAQFDGRFDRFWETLRSQNNGLLCVRDRANLNWRFQQAIESETAWVFEVGDETNLHAYAICLRQDSPKIGLKRMRLADLQCLPGRDDALPKLISTALARCDREGIHTFEVIGFGAEKKSQIEAIAPFHRRLPSWMFLYKVRDANLARELEDSRVWDPCTYDGDGWLAQVKSG